MLVAVSLVACGSGRDVADSASSPALPPADRAEIAWFDGSVVEAFAVSDQTGKPVFLFWHAPWCGACDNVRANVFTRVDFIERTRHFIPVSLNLDAPGAQRWGEHFGMRGTPTMIVFGPGRAELARLTGGVQYQQYARVLDTARAATAPITDLLAAAGTEPDTLAGDDWERLANHGWVIDNGRTVPKGELADTFEALAAACPVPRWRTRFQLMALSQRVATAEAPADALAGEQRPAANALLSSALADEQIRSDNLTTLMFSGPRLVQAVAPDDQARESLHRALRQLIAEARGDERLRLLSWYPELQLHQQAAPDLPLPEPAVDQLRDSIQAAMASATTPAARQLAVVSGGNLLITAGYPLEGEALLLDHLDTAVDPKYYYEIAARSAEQRGAHDTALGLQRRGWDHASGPVTDFHAGSIYVAMRLRLAPDDTEAIEAAVSRLLTTLEERPDSYYARSRRRLDNLATQLRDWATAHEAEALLPKWQKQLNPVCAHIDATDGLRAGCEQVFVPAV